MLSVPYRSQHDADARNFRADCGPAVAAMLIEYLTTKVVRIDALAAKTELAQGVDGVSLRTLTDLLATYGIRAWRRQLTLSDIRREVAAGNPVIALIAYGKIPNRLDTKYTAGHFVIVTDVTDTAFIVNDPDWWGTRREEGKGFRISYDAMMAACTHSPAPFWHVVVEGKRAMAEIDALAEHLKGYPDAESLAVGIGRNGTAERTFTIPAFDLKRQFGVDGWDVKEVTEARLRVRAKPGTDGAIIGYLSKGQRVSVKVAEKNGDYTWYLLQTGGYVAGEYLAAPTAPNPPVPVPVPVPVPIGDGSKRFGVNFLGPGAYNALIGLATQFRSGGKDLGPTVVTNEPKALHAIAPLTDARLIYRHKTGDAMHTEPSPRDWQGRAWSAREWFDYWFPLLKPGIRTDGKPWAVGFVNEVWRPEQMEYWNAWFIDLMAICRNHKTEEFPDGVTCTVGNFSVGVFDDRHVEGLRPLAEAAIRYGQIMSFNTYYERTNTALWTYMMPFVNRHPTLRWLIGELGYGGLSTDAAYPGDTAFDGLLRDAIATFAHPGLEGIALWAMSEASERWRHSNIPARTFSRLIALAPSRSVPTPDPVPPKSGVPKRGAGVNIDLMNPTARPPIGNLDTFAYVRLPYNVSRAAGGFGNTDVSKAGTVYDGYLNDLIDAGITPVLVLDHMTYGEGAGFNWQGMSEEDWQRLIRGHAEIVKRVAERYRDRVVYQIWNEGDKASEAAVGIPASVYAQLLDLDVQAIRSVAPNAKIISQGHVSGDVTYWQKVASRSAVAASITGVAIHPYGLGGGEYGWIGPLEPTLQAWSAVLQDGQTLWLTEWGVIGRRDDPASDVAEFVATVQAVASKYPKIAASIWFAYGDQHNCYGLEANGVIRSGLVRSIRAFPSV